MSDHVFQEPVAPSSAKQVRRNNEHAGRADPILIIGHEHVDARLCQRPPPNALGAVSRFGVRTDLRYLIQSKERWQIIEASEPGDWHE
jgi:hypothetical protein